MPSIWKDFQCAQCGEACRGWFIEVEAEEAAGITEKLRQCNLVGYRDLGFEFSEDEERTIFTRSKNGRCCFLEASKCLLHSQFGYKTKPEVCRSYPFYEIRTPQITFLNATLSCTAVREMLKTPSKFTAILPKQTTNDIFFVKMNIDSKHVILSSTQAITWDTFYALQRHLYAIESNVVDALDCIWHRICNVPEQYVSKEILQKIVTPPFARHSRPDPFKHLESLWGVINFWQREFTENLVVSTAITKLQRQLGIVNGRIDAVTALRYQSHFAKHISPISAEFDCIFENYVRAHLFISHFYFIRNIVEAISLIALIVGMVYFLALASMGDHRKLETEHLLNAIFVVEKYFFHSDILDNLDLSDVQPGVAASPL